MAARGNKFTSLGKKKGLHVVQLSYQSCLRCILEPDYQKVTLFPIGHHFMCTYLSDWWTGIVFWLLSEFILHPCYTQISFGRITLSLMYRPHPFRDALEL